MLCLRQQTLQPFRAHRQTSRRVVAVRVRCAAGAPTVVVTREHGKNGKLMAALSKHSIQCVELPLIEHAPGPDRDRLPGLLQAGAFDWVACTSPESAAVFLEGWRAAGSPKVRVAVVGGGTGEVLAAAGVTPEFTATKALGKVMGAELPHIPGGSDVVLYPASVKASTDLQDSLAAAGFSVQRINTYNTIGISTVDQALLQQALAADVVTFGSPSAVKAWVALVGLQAAAQKMNVCIGSTSARACGNVGLPADTVIFPDAPGIDEWARCVLQGLQKIGKLPAVVA
uniref:Uroporphyrinogen-III synthase n=1 Tax=Tetradesmus obliquus TaxID=3088 RepID=A0A383V9M9_TETOB|eukprot:jgi/Sobl393_1/7380/SZX61653.1